MTDPWTVAFEETVAQRRVESIPYAHLSIELGHLYFEEFANGFHALVEHFERIQPWVETVTRAYGDRVPSGRPRISTCFLVDDYFTRFSSPAEVLPQLIKAAESQNVTIDYIARESACETADGAPLADLVESRLVADPNPGTTGVRPPTSETGWLCNGERSPRVYDGQAMSTASREWRPPSENGAVNHSIFLDVELWNVQDGRRKWSCPYLAAIWQLLRLGLLRYGGSAVATPVPMEQFPDDWDRLPPVVRVNPKAQPFAAYQAFSVLQPRFLPIEHAVRTILQQFSVDPLVADQVRERSLAEGMPVQDEVWRRIAYLFAP